MMVRVPTHALTRWLLIGVLTVSCLGLEARTDDEADSSRARPNILWIVTEDNGPFSYYTYDRRSKEAKFLFYNRPDLRRYELASMEPFSFESRDGLSMPTPPQHRG